MFDIELIVSAAVGLDCILVPVAEMTQRLDEGEAPSQEEAAGSVLADGAESRSYCPPGWSRFGYRCFNYFSSALSWADAERHCLHFDGNLASIHTAEEYRYIQDMVRAEAIEDTPAWIGGTDAVKNRQWFWSDGSKFDFHAWSTSQPNNSGGRQPCIEINFGSDRRWNDWSCDDRRSFVCARELLMC
uniref:C-type lectin domain-containing protein n=1 Tax=Myripristis murdjan TaxID=586833 RepID=A0A667Z210_9TELE